MSRRVPVGAKVIREERRRAPSPALVGVLSDSHVSASGKRWSVDPALDFLRRARVDYILHAGDAGHPEVLRELAEIAPVAGVHGNADPIEMIEELPERILLDVGSRTILLMHGHQGRTAVRAARAAATPEIDLIVFGHSHQPLIATEGRTILFNPGSHTERRWNPHFGLGLISITDAKIEPDLILFDDPRQLEKMTP